MAMEGCNKFMKIILILFNLIILLIGIAAVAVGVWAHVSEYGASEMKDLTGSELYTGSTVTVIVAGSLVIVISFLGCCGAWTEKRFLLSLYIGCLTIFLIIFVAGAIVTFILRDEVENELENQLIENIKNYGKEDSEVTEIWDKIQSELKCCGVSGDINSKTSWFVYQAQKSHFITSQAGRQTVRLVPTSCCNADDNDDCQLENTVSTIPPQENYTLIDPTTPNPHLYSDGCLSKLKDKIEDHIIPIAAIGISIIVVMLLCIIFACCICMEVRKQSEIV